MYVLQYTYYVIEVKNVFHHSDCLSPLYNYSTLIHLPYVIHRYQYRSNPLGHLPLHLLT